VLERYAADVNREAAIQLVSKYLRLVERRDLDAATRQLAPGVVITFPGGREFGTLEEQVAASRQRFSNVRKEFERFDVLEDGQTTIVYVMGTLTGVDVAGVPFDSVRFVDRFSIQSGLITDHRVWNDVGDFLAARKAARPDSSVSARPHGSAGEH
jgi:ketosteroid isomerase-like protein